MADTRNNTNHSLPVARIFWAAVDADLLANGASPRPELRGGDIIYQDGVARLFHFVVSQPAALYHTNSQSLKIAGADDVNFGGHLRVWLHNLRWGAGDQSTMILPAERQGVDSANALDPGQCMNNIYKSLINQPSLFGGSIPIEGRQHHRSQKMVCLETRIRSKQLDEASYELAANDYQAHCYCHLRNHQRA